MQHKHSWLVLDLLINTSTACHQAQCAVCRRPATHQQLMAATMHATLLKQASNYEPNKHHDDPCYVWMECAQVFVLHSCMYGYYYYYEVGKC